MPVTQARSTFSVNLGGYPTVVHRGDLYDAADPIVTNNPHRFAEPRVRTSPGYHVPEPEPPAPEPPRPARRPRKVEAATAEPGEERGADLAAEG